MSQSRQPELDPTPTLEVGWLRPAIVIEEISQDSHDLQVLIDSIEKQTPRSAELEVAQQELKDEVKAISALVAARNAFPNNEDAKSLRDKLKFYRKRAGRITQRTCRVLLHYQQVFDVLNEQAPQYTAAIWGATKLLLLVVCNNADTRDKLERCLEDLAAKLQAFDIVAQFRPTELVQRYITTAIKSFLCFLKDAIKYFGEGTLKHHFKGIVQPWETRFKPKLDGVLADIETAREHTQAAFQLETGVQLQRIVRDVKQVHDKVQYTSQQLDALLDAVAPFHGLDVAGAGRASERIIESKLEQVKDAMQMASAQPQIEQMSQIPQIQLQPANQPYEHTQVGSMREASTSRAGPIMFGNAVSRNDIPVVSMLSDNRSPYTSLRSVFYGIEETEQSLEELMELLRRDAEMSSLAVQNVERNKAIGQWITEPSSCMLWITGFREYNNVNWMTTFALRMLHAVQKRKGFLYLYACCGAFNRTEEPVSTTRLAQSLVVQLLEQIKGGLNWTTCKLAHLTARRLEQCQESTEEVFRVLHQLLDIAVPSNIFIVIDSVHRLPGLRGSPRASESTEDMRVFFNALLRLTMVGQSRVKIMVTSWPPVKPRELLGKQSLTHPNLHVVNIPKELSQPLPGSSLRRQRYRLSTEEQIRNQSRRSGRRSTSGRAGSREESEDSDSSSLLSSDEDD